MIALVLALGCRLTDKVGDSEPPDSDTGPSQCVQYVPREPGGVPCVLMEMGDGSPLVWYGRDAVPGQPLEVRVRVREAEIAEALDRQITAWNAVLEGRGVLLRYVADDAPMDQACALDSLFELPEQVVGVCVATAEEWAAVPEENLGNAYYSRVNSPCDATIRGGLVMLNPDYVGRWGEPSLGIALGHMSSIVSIGDDTALLSVSWTGNTTPVDALEGECVAYQYRSMLE